MSLLSAHGAAHLVSHYGAWVVGAVVGLESMGLPLPAESLLLAVGLTVFAVVLFIYGLGLPYPLFAAW